jgi:hypothetical protein
LVAAAILVAVPLGVAALVILVAAAVARVRKRRKTREWLKAEVGLLDWPDRRFPPLGISLRQALVTTDFSLRERFRAAISVLGGPGWLVLASLILFCVAVVFLRHGYSVYYQERYLPVMQQIRDWVAGGVYLEVGLPLGAFVLGAVMAGVKAVVRWWRS